MPASEIVQYAKEQTIDLIVMGTHGRGFMGHAVMGSVAEKVVRTAPCPVLTVRNSPQHQFVTADQVAVKTLVSA
jgi:nucleotide-binding universal stress UspA family protein